MAWTVVPVLDTTATQASFRIRSPQKSIGKRAIVQVGDNGTGLLTTLTTGVFWSTGVALAAQNATQYIPDTVILAGGFLGTQAGSAALISAVGDFVGVKVSTLGGSNATIKVFVAFED